MTKFDDTLTYAHRLASDIWSDRHLNRFILKWQPKLYEAWADFIVDGNYMTLKDLGDAIVEYLPAKGGKIKPECFHELLSYVTRVENMRTIHLS